MFYSFDGWMCVIVNLNYDWSKLTFFWRGSVSFCSFLLFSLMQLAKDLLHPSPEEEKRRHKKKRLVQSPNSYFMDVKCPGTGFQHANTPDQNCCVATSGGDVGIIFFLTCILSVFFRMLQDHDGVQPCSDSRAVCGLFNGPVSAHWRQSTSHRGSVLFCSIHITSLTAVEL